MPKSFSSTILSWYAKNKRDLPWRRTRDPYKIWVSEMMLQQTTVAAVIPYFERWFKLFPTVQGLAGADIQAVLKAWQGLGYYARARNLHKAAQIVSEEYGGVLPQDAAAVRALPGFGPYSTGSVLSIAYDMPLPIIDANVRRVFMRLLAMPGQADAKQDAAISAHLSGIFPKRSAGDFNQSLMELGALICRSKEPLCGMCPVRGFCRAFEEGRQEIIPEPKARSIKDVQAVIALIRKGEAYFIQQRPSTGLLAGLWEFPGGKVEEGESKEQALVREMREELGVQVVSSAHMFDVVHYYTQFRVRLAVYSCSVDRLPQAGGGKRWVRLGGMHRYPMPSGTAKIIEKLEKMIDKRSR